MPDPYDVQPVESFLGGKVELRPGDCREVIKTLPNNSIDSIVTDPPYALTFMGKQWDNGEVAFDPEFWTEVYRVLKPGGHIISFGGTRTYHRMVVAIEDAGFEIRDQLAWVYGSGFPKSHDVSKGIERRRVEDEAPVRVVCRAVRAAMDARGLKSDGIAAHFGFHSRMVDHWAARDTDSQPSLPTNEQWARLRELLPLDAMLDAEVARLNARKGEPGDVWYEREVVGQKMSGIANKAEGLRHTIGASSAVVVDITAPATDAARQWQGWGTALKPAWEPICLARKPLIGTVAENVLTHGTGALNIDGCRVESIFSGPGSTPKSSVDGRRGSMAGAMDRIDYDGSGGRWPANLVHDGSDEVLAGFPASSGFGGQYGGTDPGMWAGKNRVEITRHNDSGSAARFFYTAKADQRTRLGARHPTVKPLDLMQWLCRLVTPKGGIVLDPFAGTGTTGEAAWREGFKAVLIEREADSCDDIRMRLQLAAEYARREAVARTKRQLRGAEGTPLFPWTEGRLL